jgi:hypothetical protein
MPLPKTKNVGKIMDKLKSEGGRGRDQMVAIALSQARKNGAKIPAPKGKPNKKNVAMTMRAAKMGMAMHA